MQMRMDHAVLQVSDFDVARRFYEKLFSYAGWMTAEDEGEEQSIGFRQSDGFTIWLKGHPGLTTGPENGHLDHMALKCESREQVDAAHVFCKKQEWTILSEPSPAPAYGNFYGFSFEGPDGLKIEFATR